MKKDNNNTRTITLWPDEHVEYLINKLYETLVIKDVNENKETVSYVISELVSLKSYLFQQRVQREKNDR